ncbi:MAG: phenylalanine--tRNA ligase subunit beta [Bacteroidetes bacterium]|nr:MAG: phenylalanine--tRNA ligase subunit beta [Bacteroidota bacterium]
MKVALSWLKDHIELNENAEQLDGLLTGCGLEVEHTEEVCSIEGGLKGLVIGEVLTCAKHPNADKLSVTTVKVAEDRILPIVCGAPNVAAGQKVVVAVPGTTIYPSSGEPFTINKSKIRGEVSEGMICAEDEVGLGESHAGIMVLDAAAQVGTAAADYFKVEQDVMLEIGLTANRGDAASHRGVARDLSALLHRPLKKANLSLATSAENKQWTITLKDADCPRYTGILLENIEVKESPDWLKNRLKSIGLNPINNVVDVTNFVLHDIGQPIHAFDADQIKGEAIIVQKAEAGSVFVTLDGEERKMQGTELMICNAEEPMAIAGVFGGLKSGVSSSTKRVFIESAYFDPASIRKTAKLHGLSTDASFRYERGTDPEITIFALEKVVVLLHQVAGAKVASRLIDVYPEPVKPFDVKLERIYLDKLLGVHVPSEEVERILLALEIEIKLKDADSWTLQVPAFKSDVTRPADVAEEIIRIYGLDKVPMPEKVAVNFGASKKPEPYKMRKKASELLVSRGFSEVSNNSMTKAAHYSEEVLAKSVYLKNPLSNDMNVMRPGMLAGLLENVAYNRNRKNHDLKFFEFGKVYRKSDDGKYQESMRLAMLISGSWTGENWHGGSRASDFYLLKQEVEAVMLRMGMKCRDSKRSHEVWNAPEATEAWMQIAPISKKLLKAFDIQADVYYAELDWDKLTSGVSAANRFYSKPAPKFPAVRRDLSLVLDQNGRFADLEKIIKETDKGLIRDVHVFDVYEGDKLPEGKKSYSISFVLQNEEKTLSDKEIDALMNKLIVNFEQRAGAQIRK